MGPQSRPAEFSSSRPPGTRGTSREMLEHALDPGPNAAADFVLDACTFRGQSATIGSPAARRPGAEGGRRGVVGVCRFLFAQIRHSVGFSLGGTYSRAVRLRPACRGDRGTAVPLLNTGVPGSPRTSRHGRTGATVRPDRVRRSELAYRGVCHRLGGSGSVAKRSATHPARLETRTKESNMCASQGARRNPEAQ